MLLRGCSDRLGTPYLKCVVEIQGRPLRSVNSSFEVDLSNFETQYLFLYVRYKKKNQYIIKMRLYSRKIKMSMWG